MSRIRYSVAISLMVTSVGQGEKFDWIKMDPDFDFNALVQAIRHDRRRAWQAQRGHGGRRAAHRCPEKTIVVSTTLRPEDHPDVTIINGIEALTDLKARPGRTSGYLAAESFFAASQRRELGHSGCPSCPFS